MILSDPDIGVSGVAGQFGQFDLFMQPSDQIVLASPLLACTGFIRSAPQFLALSPTWTTPVVPTNPSILACYKDVYLQRDAIRKYVIPAPDWLVSTVAGPFPQAVYLSPHWITPILQTNVTRPGTGNVVSLGSFYDMKWLLYYGTIQGLLPTQYADGILPQDDLLSDPFDEADSQWFDSNPSSLDTNSIQGVGWSLWLLHRALGTNVIGSNQIGAPAQTTVDHRPYVGYQLGPQTSVASSTPILDATRPSLWTMFHNAIGLPPHTLTLEPMGS